MIKVNFDMPKLRRSLERAAKGFGDTNKQAVARWGVQVCRELAVSTQVYGKAGAKKKQMAAIEAGIHAVIATVTPKEFDALKTGKRKQAKIRNRWVSVSPERLLDSLEACDRWVEQQRNNDPKGHASRLPQDQIAVAPQPLVKVLIEVRRQRAGIAKGAWLGAGMQIAKKQKGADRISIGKNFLGYAQKHSARGKAKASGDDFKPFATLSNRAKHSASGYVLAEGEKSSAVGFGLKKTLSWYRAAARRALNKS